LGKRSFAFAPPARPALLHALFFPRRDRRCELAGLTSASSRDIRARQAVKVRPCVKSPTCARLSRVVGTTTDFRDCKPWCGQPGSRPGENEVKPAVGLSASLIDPITLKGVNGCARVSMIKATPGDVPRERFVAVLHPRKLANKLTRPCDTAAWFLHLGSLPGPLPSSRARLATSQLLLVLDSRRCRGQRRGRRAVGR
jgi:hypothetical protein